MKRKIVTITVISLIAACAFAFTACNKKSGYTTLGAQADIFKELNAKTADVGIMDYTMANYLLRTESAMANNLMIADIAFEEEYYGIAFRKAADGKYNALTDLVNKTLVELKDSEYKTIAEKYGISGSTLDITYSAPSGEADNTELDYVVSKGKIVIGFTLNAPMALGEGDKTTGGFDTDLANAVFAKISETTGKTIAVEFKLIDWSKKEAEMESKAIDCVWNGMTVTPARCEMWSVSINYLANRQCAVIRKSDKDKYNTLESLKNARIVAEDGSAGEEAAKSILGIAA
ncbi:MAG: transporter substrate-binding domain-containing protein [Christensenellaceae bacterium]|nr:transporter substrate-binding domain-containing protein [Christensenellaceae bacterium]